MVNLTDSHNENVHNTNSEKNEQYLFERFRNVDKTEIVYGAWIFKESWYEKLSWSEDHNSIQEKSLCYIYIIK